MSDYNMKTIREMVTAAFSAGEIRTMTFDLFYSLYQDFPAGMLKSQMLEAVLEHAQKYGGIEKIIDHVREKNPYQYNRFSAELVNSAPAAEEVNMGGKHQGDRIYGNKFEGDQVAGDKFDGDKIGGNKIEGNQYNYYYGSAGPTAAPTTQNLPDFLSDVQKRRLLTIHDNIEREQELLEQFEAQRRYETNPRRLMGIDADIKRQKETIDRFIGEAAELGVTISKVDGGKTADSVAEEPPKKEELTESPEDRALDYVPGEQAWYPAVFPEIDEFDYDNLERFQKEVDVVIMVATRVELEAALNLLERYPKRKSILEAQIGPETYFLGKFGYFRTAVTRCGMGAGGKRGSTLATPDAINTWKPKAVIMPGIAFGKNPEKQKMADVLVAQKILPYDHERVGDQIIPRGEISHSDATLQNRFESAYGWRFERPDGRTCSLHLGSVLSGSKLVDNQEFKSSLFQKFPEAIGGEMEGAGLAAAANRLRVPWILVKAICDWGTGKSDAHQPLAAASAVSLIHHVLSKRNALNGL